MTLPMISLNGTTREELVETLCKASYALSNAIDALKQTAPHGRDYPQNLKKATEEHYSRVNKIKGYKVMI